MPDDKPLADGKPPADQTPRPPTATREPAPLVRTSRSRSWLLPTTLVVVVLTVVVVLGRAGQVATTLPSAAPYVSLPATGAADAASPVTSLPPRPVVEAPGGLVGPQISIRSGTANFTDGIPAFISGEPVFRVREAAVLAVGSTILVGGWQTATRCEPPSNGDCATLLSDVPIRSPRMAALALAQVPAPDNTGAENADGARVVRATIELDPACTVVLSGTCLPRLAVVEPVWCCEQDTSTAPIAPAALLAAVTGLFPDLDFRTFEESTSCPATWPVQSWLASSKHVSRADLISLPVRLIALFPTADALAAAAPNLRASLAKLTAFQASNTCVSIPGGLSDEAWIVRGNVMVLLGAADPAVQSEVEAALDAASSGASGS